MWEKEVIIKEMKNHGMRITKQRRTVLDVMTTEECQSVKELYYKVAKRDPDIGMATVYRTILTLEEIGLIERNRGYVPAKMEEIAQ